MIVKDNPTVARLYREMTPVVRPGSLRGPDDFGDPQTIWLRVVRRGIDWRTGNPATDWGIFLGLHHGQYVVANEGGCALCQLVGQLAGVPTQFSRVELFDTLEELHQQWELD